MRNRDLPRSVRVLEVVVRTGRADEQPTVRFKATDEIPAVGQRRLIV
jgi:hypothetical protein